MRYEDLFEENSPDLFNHIEQNGLSIIKSKVVLYRGSNMSEPHKSVLLKTRFDRRPTDTPQVIHDIMDVWFFNKFGIKARSQSIFTTSKLTFAQRYGNPTAILPVGDATYLYSNNVDDLFSIISKSISNYISLKDYETINQEYNLNLDQHMSVKKIFREISNTYLNDEIPTALYRWFKEMIFEFMDTLNYVSTRQLNANELSGVEVMVHCNEYYSVGRKSPESYKLEAKYGYLI